MTFPSATLIHCRHQPRIARVAPGAKPMAATLVAAILLLGISAAARRQEPNTTKSGIQPSGTPMGSRFLRLDPHSVPRQRQRSMVVRSEHCTAPSPTIGLMDRETTPANDSRPVAPHRKGCAKLKSIRPGLPAWAGEEHQHDFRKTRIGPRNRASVASTSHLDHRPWIAGRRSGNAVGVQHPRSSTRVRRSPDHHLWSVPWSQQTSYRIQRPRPVDCLAHAVRATTGQSVLS